MQVNTRLFGEIDIDDAKIITLTKGIIGFPDLCKFTLIYDEEENREQTLMWLQSMDEPQFAIPVVTPDTIFPDYNPTVEDDMLMELGELNEDNTYCLVTMKVPKDITQMTVNLKAPIIINTDTLKGNQIIIEDDLPVRQPVYEILKARKEQGGED
ncbi:MAG: flagellar assembly protein FliW [Lachnospiraceae bacterium]|nr:flagellar assembly protein FliW [Lachnospiraceae bacterium]